MLLNNTLVPKNFVICKKTFVLIVLLLKTSFLKLSYLEIKGLLLIDWTLKNNVFKNKKLNFFTTKQIFLEQN